MRFAVESWAPEYGTPAGGEPLEPAAADVNPSVEVPAESWAPRTPARAPAPARVLFVDGVRRVDARVWITGEDGVARPGVAASYAAGVVCCEPASARIDRCEVRRTLFSAAPGLEAVATRHGEYRPCAVAADGLDALLAELHEAMGILEARVAAEADAGADLIVVDGPLTRLPAMPCAVGYVKTHHRSYLPAELGAVVAALRPGQRTPLFVTSARWSRHAWYARLPDTGSGDRDAHPLAGIIRGEVSGDVATAEAARLADLATAALPAYASAAHKDPRAPQNLVPIGELERSLRHHLGDATLLYRSLRVAAGRGGRPLPTPQKSSRR